MDILLSLFSFSFIASFTPGPNNLLVMSQGINHGLRSTYTYQLGAGLSCFIISFGLFCLGSEVEKILPTAMMFMRYAGCAYMLYLAWLVFRSSPGGDQTQKHVVTFRSGMLLQFINPKFYMYTLTLAAAIIPVTTDTGALFGYAVFFSVIAVLGMYAWAASGDMLQNFLTKHYKATNSVMALALVYCSFSLFV